jgi:hypothetical protein
MNKRKNLESMVMKKKFKRNASNIIKKSAILTGIIFASTSFQLLTYYKTHSELEKLTKLDHQVEYSRYIVDKYDSSQTFDKVLMYGAYSAAKEYVNINTFDKNN